MHKWHDLDPAGQWPDNSLSQDICFISLNLPADLQWNSIYVVLFLMLVQFQSGKDDGVNQPKLLAHGQEWWEIDGKKKVENTLKVHLYGIHSHSNQPSAPLWCSPKTARGSLSRVSLSGCRHPGQTGWRVSCLGVEEKPDTVKLYMAQGVVNIFGRANVTQDEG